MVAKKDQKEIRCTCKWIELERKSRGRKVREEQEKRGSHDPDKSLGPKRRGF